MPHTVLSVDADATARSARNEVLRQAGFHVIDAAGGTDALQLASANQPTLVVLAIELPGLDGFAVCKQLKADPRTAFVPVLHISSQGECYRHYPESLESGADAYLPEPVEPPVLIAVAAALIRACTGGARTRNLEVDRAMTLLPEQNPTPVLRVGADGALLYANPGSNVLVAAWKCQVGQPVPDDLRHAVEEAVAQGAPAEFDVRAGGRDYSFVVAPIAGCGYANLYGQDLTQRNRLADQLRERIEELETVMEVAPVAIWVAHDPECQEITGNGLADRYYEAGAGENVSANVSAARRFFRDGRELRPQELPMQEAAARGIEIRNSELDVLLPSGRQMNMLGSASPLRNAVGQVRGCVGAFLDITEGKRAEEALRESEAVLRSFFDSPGMIRGIVETIDGRIVHVSCNTAAAEMYGVDRESIAGKSASEAGTSEEIARSWVDLYEESQRTGKPASMEYPRRGADGQERWLLATASYLGTGPSGNPRFAYTALDLSDRKRVEDALRESEERFRIMADGCPTIIWVTDAKGGLRFVNRGYREFFGVTYEQVEGGQWQPLVHPDDAPEYVGAFLRAVRKRAPFRAEARVRRADGAWRWVASYGEPRWSPGGEFLGYASISPDITEHKQAEEALHQSEKMYRAIGESIDYGVWVCTPDGRNTYASESFLKLVGLTQEQCSNFGWGDVLHPDDAERTIAAWKECVRTEGRWDIEHLFRGVDGEWHPILARGVPVRDEQGQITCWAGINLDISVLKQTEESLRESESRERARTAELEALMDAAPGSILIAHDTECRYISGNRMAYGLMRRLPASNLSKSAPESERPANFRVTKDGIDIPPEELPMQKAASTGRPVRNHEAELVFEDGASVNMLGDAVPLLDEGGRPRGAVGVFVDITERKRAEARLGETQKLESLGLLAGGVAHDFNNLLVGVIGNASMAREMLPPDHPVAELLAGVLKTGEQAAHLTRQMLAYSGKGKFMVEALDLSALIPELSGLVRTSISKKITLHLALEEDLPAVEADRGQIQQVFMNLALNAAEAIGSHEGLIAVKTGVQDVDDRYTRLHLKAAELRPGKYVYFEVRDTGCGMDDATRARIFDPFFSTKFTGRGLGLAAVAGILRGHKGSIVVSSAPGKGSCFTVLFPAAARAAEERPVAARNAASQGSGVVLVVDDEKLVREMVKKALEHYGYTVLLAESGLAAIDVLRRHPGDIALVILDLSMPRMSGEEALPELRKIRPEVKVLVSSGYSEAETMTLFQGQRVSGFIQKPYTGAGLAEKVKVCLG